MISSMQRFLLLALALGAAATPALANGDLALGRAGEVYHLRQGAAGELFGTPVADPTAPALALEVTLPTGAVSRLPIPGSDDQRIEEKAGLLFDEASNTLILWWRSRGADGASSFRFASYDTELSPIGTLQSGVSPVLFRTEPRFGVSRDAFAVQLINDQVIVAHRTTLHLAWRDEATGRAFYVPVQFVEGQWVGWNEAYDVSGIVRSRHAGEELTPVGGPFAAYLDLAIDENRRAAAITLVDGPSGRLSEVEVRFLPMNLGQVGERVRNRFFRIATVFKPSEDLEAVTLEVGFQIVHIGLRGLGSEALTALADGLRRGVIHLNGVGCDAAAAAPRDVYVGLAGIGKDGALGLPQSINGEFMHVAVIGREAGNLEALIGGVGFQIVHIGSIAAGCTPAGGETHDMIQVAETGEILHIDLTGERLTLDPANASLFGGDNGQHAALVESSALWLRNEVTAPQLGETSGQVLISPSSGDFVVAWVDGNLLRFAETQRHLWTPPGEVALSEAMTPELAIELLRKKLR